jgi:hypothetical protein
MVVLLLYSITSSPHHQRKRHHRGITGTTSREGLRPPSGNRGQTTISAALRGSSFHLPPCFSGAYCAVFSDPANPLTSHALCRDNEAE